MPFRLLFVAALLACAGGTRAAAAPLAAYLPEVPRDPTIVDPETFFGHEIGIWHLRPEQILAYAEAVAAASDRVEIRRTGQSYEGRPLVIAVVTAPESHAGIETIRDEHRAISEPGIFRDPGATDPVVVYLGYSIHGNESSGSNAAPLVLYHLASAQDEETERLLRGAVILLDPLMNPDGLARFAHWANTNRSLHPNPDPRDREHNEDWPSGRTNHYHFDLNRDWLPAQHPESQARLAVFQEWRPNVVADFHEMGSDGTYFFQPGVPSRRNPLIPEENVALTERLAGFHQRALDEIGSLYYSEEDFDDFYFGKGSTYPDIQGAVGVLFEQASSRGHRRQTANGEIDFAFTIRNQVTTSFSTLAGSLALRSELLDYQRRFYREAVAEVEGGAWLVGDRFDPQRVAFFVELLQRHAIEVRELARPIVEDGESFLPGSAYLVPRNQRQARLLRALVERSTEVPDSLFYDVSAWTLPLAFGLPFVELAKIPGDAEGAVVSTTPSLSVPPLVPPGDALRAVVFSWDRYYAPRALGRLLAAGFDPRVATRATTFDTGEGPISFEPGAIFLPLAEAPDAELSALLATIASEDGIELHALTSGAARRGVDLGSPSLEPLHAPRVLLAAGPGTSSGPTGALWHLLDARFAVPVTRISREAIPTALDDYTHLVLAGGNYGDWSEEQVTRIRRWIEQGGVLVGVGGASTWLSSSGLLVLETRAESPEVPLEAPYASAAVRHGARALSGTIFSARVDRTHPLAYGYRRGTCAVLRDARTFLEPSENPYETVVRLEQDPLLAGYLHASQRQAVAGSASLVARKLGAGTVVLFVDDPSFRAFWFGSHRFLLNAIYFGKIVAATPK